ncbi:MAG: hypothetical protein Q8Q03_02630 [bacterium]|nr:hypothetical protein [bacterium]
MIPINNPLALALLAGVLFGIWPYAMDKSGLKGISAPTAFLIFQTLVLLLLTVNDDSRKGNRYMVWITGALVVIITIFVMIKWTHEVSNWSPIAIAGFCGGMGLWSTSRMLDIVKSMNDADRIRPTYLVTIFVMQVAVSVLVFVYQNPKDISIGKFIGYVLASLGVILMHKG